MIKKTENCLYCGEKMESKTAKKKFCSDLHRVYYNREKERGTLGLEIVIKNGKPELMKYNRESVLPTHKTDNSQHKIPDALTLQRIADLEKELKNPPANPMIGLRNWRWVREQKLKQLKNEI